MSVQVTQVPANIKMNKKSPKVFQSLLNPYQKYQPPVNQEQASLVSELSKLPFLEYLHEEQHS